MNVETPIGLGQFLKLSGLAETGGQAKELIAAGEVTVNGEVAYARSRQLHCGDRVATPLGEERVQCQ